MGMLPEAEMIRLWEQHTELEFATRDAAATVATMTPHNYVNHVPVMTGGRGTAEMLEFYGKHFIPKMPADATLRPLARTVGNDRLIDEFIFSCTHDVVMDWMLPGVAPTGRKIEIPMVVDQASVLVQIGLLDPAGLPVAGVETARKFEDPQLPSNALIRGAAGRH
jgi:carboxymethylenebutenolidase